MFIYLTPTLELRYILFWGGVTDHWSIYKTGRRNEGIFSVQSGDASQVQDFSAFLNLD